MADIQLTKNDPAWKFAAAIEQGLTFTNSGDTLYGRTEFAGFGRYAAFDKIDLDQLREAVYVVYSYGTPIAWETRGGGWVLNRTKYSVTTSGHQSKIFDAIRQRFTVL
jgi:hypothetical protein